MMPFGLCNAPATFQRAMMGIFSDLIENAMEVFMDDFSVYETVGIRNAQIPLMLKLRKDRRTKNFTSI
jgi:hypothetical protein